MFLNPCFLGTWLWTGRPDDGGSISGEGCEFFLTAPCLDCLWGLVSLLSNRTGGSFPRGKAAGPWTWCHFRLPSRL